MTTTKRHAVVLVLCSVLCSVLAVSLSAQEEFTHTSGLRFTLPAGWSYAEVEDHFEASSPDETVSLLFFVGHAREAQDALEEAATALDSIMTDQTILTDPTEETINGLLQIYVEGDGVIDGVLVDWDLTLVLGGRQTMIVVVIGAIEEYRDVIDDIYASIAA